MKKSSASNVAALSMLYELSIASCSRLDIYSNADHFTRSLIMHKELDQAGYFNFSGDSPLQICIPPGDAATIDPDISILSEIMDQYDVKILDASDMTRLSPQYTQTEKYQACYKFDTQSFYIVGRDKVAFTTLEIDELKGVIFQFGNFMNGLIMRDRLKIENGKRREIERKIRQKNSELEKYINSNLQLEKFAHIASHDLKAPLRAIYSFSKLLKDRILDKLDEKERKYLDIINVSSQSMTKLINSLLEYSKVDGKALKFERIDLGKTLKVAVSFLNAIIEAEGAQVNYAISSHSVIIDKEEFAKLIYFIISNSLHFAKPGVKPIIGIKSYEQNDSVIIELSDNGVGVQEAYHERVFDMFSKLDTRNRGSGMGLAICKKIIEKHQGTIEMKSNDQGGVTILICLPLDAEYLVD